MFGYSTQFYIYGTWQNDNSATNSLYKEATFVVKLSTMLQLLPQPACTPAPHAGNYAALIRPLDQDWWTAPLPSDPLSWIFQPVCYLNSTGEAFRKIPQPLREHLKPITSGNQLSNWDPWAWLKLWGSLQPPPYPTCSFTLTCYLCSCQFPLFHC